MKCSEMMNSKHQSFSTSSPASSGNQRQEFGSSSTSLSFSSQHQHGSGPKKGYWFPEEDQKLITLYHAEGGNVDWGTIASKFENRTAKQCRERWNEYLSPTIDHSPFTVEEDFIILRSQARLGNKWKEITDLLPVRDERKKRTPTSVKVQWHCLERKIRRAGPSYLGNQLTINDIDPSRMPSSWNQMTPNYPGNFQASGPNPSLVSMPPLLTPNAMLAENKNAIPPMPSHFSPSVATSVPSTSRPLSPLLGRRKFHQYEESTYPLHASKIFSFSSSLSSASSSLPSSTLPSSRYPLLPPPPREERSNDVSGSEGTKEMTREGDLFTTQDPSHILVPIPDPAPAPAPPLINLPINSDISQSPPSISSAPVPALPQAPSPTPPFSVDLKGYDYFTDSIDPHGDATSQICNHLLHSNQMSFPHIPYVGNVFQPPPPPVVSKSYPPLYVTAQLPHLVSHPGADYSIFSSNGPFGPFSPSQFLSMFDHHFSSLSSGHEKESHPS